MLDELQVAASTFQADEQWDLLAQDDDIAQVRITAGPQIELETRRTRGIGVRLIRGGGLGAASCTGFASIGTAIARARTGAALGAPPLFEMPRSQPHATVENFDRRLAECSVQQLGDWLCSQVDEAGFHRIHDPVVEGTRAIRRRAILNSNGIAAEHARTTLTVKISGGIGEGFSRLQDKRVSCRFDIALPELFEPFLENYTQWSELDRASDSSGPRLAVFSENGTGALLSILEGTLKNAAQSPQFGLLPRMKEDLRLDPRVTISDPGDADWLPNSAPFDDEGVPKQPLTIFDAGRFRGSIHDLRTARLWNETPTGSAVRDFDAPPSAQFSNPTIASGSMSTAEMVEGIDDGILVAQLRNTRLLPQAIGQFSAEIGAGFQIEAGRIRRSLRSVPIRGNFFHLFGRNLLAIGRAPLAPQAQGIPAFMAREVYVGH